MPKLVKGPDGTVHSFPDEATDAMISGALKAIPAANSEVIPEVPSANKKFWTPILASKAASGSVALTTNAAERFATSPAVPKAFATAGRIVGGVAPTIAGAASGSPLAAVFGVGQTARGAWAGGKAGWFSGKLAQNIALPVAKALDKLAPFAKAIASSSLIAAQGGLDLAQSAEPNRKDIGVLGVGKSVKAPEMTPEKQVAIVNAVHQRLKSGLPMSAPAVQGLLRQLPQSVIQALGEAAKEGQE